MTDGPAPRVAVVTFPGSLDDGDAALALERVGAAAVPVWHGERSLPDVDAVVLPGGFSYGDYLRCGAIARFSAVMTAVAELAERGAPVLGICNGFQILCEAGLLPGALLRNRSLRFVCRDVQVVVGVADAPFTSRCTAGQTLTVPVKHGEGCFVAPPEVLAELERNDQIVLRYGSGENPNGALDDVAGIRNLAGNVMGLMPHPEHAVDPLLGSADGALILGSLVDAARERAHALVA